MAKWEFAPQVFLSPKPMFLLCLCCRVITSMENLQIHEGKAAYRIERKVLLRTCLVHPSTASATVDVFAFLSLLSSPLFHILLYMLHPSFDLLLSPMILFFFSVLSRLHFTDSSIDQILAWVRIIEIFWLTCWGGMKDLHFKQALRLPLVGRFHLNVLEYIHFSAFLTSWSVGRVSYAFVLSPPQGRSACTSSAFNYDRHRQKKGLPWWLSGKESACQCRRGWFNPWVRKMTPLPRPQRWKWQSTPVFLPGKSRGQRSLVGYSPLGHKRVGYDLVTGWLAGWLNCFSRVWLCATPQTAAHQAPLSLGFYRQEY